MSELELRVVKQEQPVIEINFEEVKKSLSASIEEYKALVVTEQTLPTCKAKQKELAGIRTKIDAERLRIKKEMSKPVDAFELECKELIKLVEATEQPLKDSIKVFDDKKRDEKRKTAEGIIQAAIEQHGLTEKYAKQLTVLDKYTLLGAKPSEVREDVEQRAFLLLEQQNKEKEMLEIIQGTIDNANKTIKAQMNMTDFQRLIDRGMSAKDVIAEINSRAEQIRIAENPPPAPVVEPITQTYLYNVESSPATRPEAQQEQKEGPGKDEKMYFAELRFVETWEGLDKLRKLLESNGYTYTKLKSGEVK